MSMLVHSMNMIYGDVGITSGKFISIVLLESEFDTKASFMPIGSFINSILQNYY